MVRPSQIARKARREHERQQDILQKKGGMQGARQSPRDCGTKKQTLLDTHVVGCGQSTIGSLVAPKPIHGMRIGSLRRKTNSGNDSSDCGMGIAYHSSKYVWDDLSWRIRGQISTYLLEMYAIVRALEIGWDMCRNQEAERKPSKIVIYSDCSGALRLFDQFRNSLKRLEKLPNAEQLIVPGIIASEALSVLEVEVELRYVPAHSGVEGNVRADRAAKIAKNHSIGKGKLTVARVVGSRA